MKIEIPVDAINQVLGYLGTRPIQAIQEAAKPQEAEPKDE